MEALRSFETVVDIYQATRRNVAEHLNLLNFRVATGVIIILTFFYPL